jgi:hypothetical protein
MRAPIAVECFILALLFLNPESREAIEETYLWGSSSAKRGQAKAKS